MFSRSVFLAFLTLALSAQAIPNPNLDQCQVISTRTVTVTAGAAAPTLNNGGNANGVKGTTTRARPAATTRASNNNEGNAAVTTTKRGGNKGNNGAASSTTSTAAAAATSAFNNGGKNNGGNNANNGGNNANNGGNNGGNNANNGGNNANNGANVQTSTTLDPRVVAPGFAKTGQEVPAAGQVASLTSTNNFINFCLTTPNLPITNGQQITTGSCNPVPIGAIPSVDNMPSSKFTFPKNFGTIKAGETFTIEMAIKNMQTGFFVNAQANYFSAPQQLNGQGQIQGHSHVVIEALNSLDQTTPTDPKKFVFFKGLNAPAGGGKLTATVPDGLEVGVYKLSSINTAANHQPVIAPIAQHGSLDDAIYFTVTADGKAARGGANNLVAVSETSVTPAASASGSASASISAAVTSASASVSASASTVRGGASSTSVASRATGRAASSSVASSSAPATSTTAGSDRGSKGRNGKASATASSSSAPAASSAPAVRGGGRRRAFVNRQA